MKLKKLWAAMLGMIVMTCCMVGLNASADYSVTDFKVWARMPVVQNVSATQGSASRSILVSWDHSQDDYYNLYLVMRRNLVDNQWKVVGTVASSKNTALKTKYAFVDNVSNEHYLYYDYAVSGAKIINNVKYRSVANHAYGWSRVNICLDPGHFIGCNSNYDYDEDTAYGKFQYSEGTQMLRLGAWLKAYLLAYRQNGNAYATCRITRAQTKSGEVFASSVTNEKYADSSVLMTRGYYARGCDYFISLHTNAENNWWETNNWGCISFPNITAQSNAYDLALAAKLGYTASNSINPGGISIQKRAPFNMTLRDGGPTSVGLTNRRYPGQSNLAYYAVVRGADEVGVPGTLVEHSYHTNPYVRYWMLQDVNLSRLARNEARTILKHYGFPVV